MKMHKDGKILGITDTVDSGAAIIENGKIISAVNEERLIRKKMAYGFPIHSIFKVLKLSKTLPEDIEYVAVATKYNYFYPQSLPFDGWFRTNRGIRREVMSFFESCMVPIIGRGNFLKETYLLIKHSFLKKRDDAIVKLLKTVYHIESPVKFVNHQYAHACSAYFTSGLKQ